MKNVQILRGGLHLTRSEMESDMDEKDDDQKKKGDDGRGMPK